MWENKGSDSKYIGKAKILKKRIEDHITNAFSKNEKQENRFCF